MSPVTIYGRIHVKSGVLSVDVLLRCPEQQPIIYIPLAVCFVGF